jgi:hypothetical protein
VFFFGVVLFLFLDSFACVAARSVRVRVGRLREEEGGRRSRRWGASRMEGESEEALLTLEDANPNPSVHPLL